VRRDEDASMFFDKGERMKPCILMSLLLVLLSNAYAQENELKFPAEQQIDLLITQSERAFDSYENTLQLEAQLVGGPESVAKDREVLNTARKVLATLKANPSKAFNSPMGFLLVTNLDDASRNMAVCMGQGGMQSANAAQAGKVNLAMSNVHISQTCLDTSQLLYTVSESALDLYAQYLSTEYKLTQQAADRLQQCVDLLKKSAPKR